MRTLIWQITAECVLAAELCPSDEACDAPSPMQRTTAAKVLLILWLCLRRRHRRRNAFYDKKKNSLWFVNGKNWRFAGIFVFHTFSSVPTFVARERWSRVAAHFGVYGTKDRDSFDFCFVFFSIGSWSCRLSGTRWNVAHDGLRGQIKYGMENAANRQQAIIESSRSDDRLSRARSLAGPKRLALEARGWTHTTLHGTVYHVCVCVWPVISWKAAIWKRLYQANDAPQCRANDLIAE